MYIFTQVYPAWLVIFIQGTRAFTVRLCAINIHSLLQTERAECFISRALKQQAKMSSANCLVPNFHG